jgi:hypothetical protein
VAAIIDEAPLSYEAAWRRITRDYRLLTRGLVLATASHAGRHAVVPAAGLLPGVFSHAVNRLAR